MTVVQQELEDRINSLSWYHTIDLGNGVLTPGFYDHRPYLHYYGFPDDLTGKSVLDIGAASGFFSFELERRGAQVTAVDLPEWFDHDFGPNYQADQTLETGNFYLHRPFEVAAEILGSRARKKHLNVYDISPETVGKYDITFCGSLLIHLTDPIRALWNIASVTSEKAIIATPITAEEPDRSLALMVGYERGDGWWIPTRTCLELMAVSAGFTAIEWISDSRLDYRDGTPGPYHGVLHAYKTPRNWGNGAISSEEILQRQRVRGLHPRQGSQGTVEDLQGEVDWLRGEVTALQERIHAYERGRFIRLTRWIHRHLRSLW